MPTFRATPAIDRQLDQSALGNRHSPETAMFVEKMTIAIGVTARQFKLGALPAVPLDVVPAVSAQIKDPNQGSILLVVTRYCFRKDAAN